MAVYVVKCDPLSGCLEPVKVSGNESLTLGCVWNSTDVAATINDCDGCQLAQFNQTSVALGVDASALNNGVSVGKSSSTTCTAIAIGCGATATDNGIAIGANLTACCDEILIGDKVAITDNTVINGCDSGCSNIVAINATATNNYQVVINRLVDVTCASVTLGCVANVNTKVALGDSATAGNCGVAIGNGATAAANAVAIGNGATATCGIDIRGANSRITSDCNGNVYVGLCNVSSNALQSDNIFGSYNTVGNVDAPNNVIIGVGNSINCDANDAILIGDANEINVCATNVIAIGMEIGSVYDTYASSIGNNDVILGNAVAYNKFCGTNGYLYRGNCLMTGRIIDCADLPATCCSLILYYVP